MALLERCEVARNERTKGFGHLGLEQGRERGAPLTEQLLDDPPAHRVVRRPQYSSPGCGLALRNHHPIAAAVLLVLRQQVRERADCGGAESNKVGRVIVRKALEVAAQVAFERCVRQRVAAGASEVVETYRYVAVCAQVSVAKPRHREPLRLGWQPGRVDHALARHDVRHMRVAEKGNAIGAEHPGTLKAVQQIVTRLVGQAVHQIEIERSHAGTPKPVNRLDDQVFALHPADRLLTMHRERLHTEARALDPDRLDRCGPLGRYRARIELDREHRIVQTKTDRQVIDQPDEIGWRDRIRASPAKGHATNARACRYAIRNEHDLAMKRREV